MKQRDLCPLSYDCHINTEHWIMLWHITKGCTPLQYVMSRLGSVPVYTSWDGGVYANPQGLNFPVFPCTPNMGLS